MTQARVFAVTQQDADTAPDVVTGMILVFDRDAHILIDPGATHSFISMGFISNVNVESQPIDCSIVVSLPTGDSRLAESVYIDSRVIIGGQECHAWRRETIYWDSLPALSDVGMSKSYNCINISYTKLKNKTTTVVVFTVSIHTVLGPIYIYKTIHYIYMIRAWNLQ